MRVLVVLLLLTSGAGATDKALILNDQEQAVLHQILDEATKFGGIEVAPNTVYFLNKLNAAPVVTPHKDEQPAAPSKPERPPE